MCAMPCSPTFPLPLLLVLLLRPPVVRDREDRWIRIAMGPGDMIVLPAGIYHRFTLDDKNFITALRLFVGDPVWTPHNRPQEDNPVRQAYVGKVGSEDGGTEESKAE